MSQRWDDRYREGEHCNREPEPLLEIVHRAAAAPGHALDLACGAGQNAIWLARHGWTVTAVDYSSVALEILRSAAGELPITAVQADLESGEFPLAANQYDLICDFYYLQRSLFEQLKEAVRPGGLFAAIIPLSGRPGSKPMNPAYLLEPGELRKLFSGWDLLHNYETNRNELIARKPLS